MCCIDLEEEERRLWLRMHETAGYSDFRTIVEYPSQLTIETITQPCRDGSYLTRPVLPRCYYLLKGGSL